MPPPPTAPSSAADSGPDGSRTASAISSAGAMAAAVGSVSVSAAGPSGSGSGSGDRARQRARFKKPPKRQGIRGALSTFASHLTPPAHPDPSALLHHSSIHRSASASSGSLSSRSLHRTLSHGTQYGSYGRAGGSWAPGQGPNSRSRATPGGWMLGTDAQYRAGGKRYSDNRGNYIDDEDDEDKDDEYDPAAPVPVVNAVVVDGRFKPTGSPSVNTTERTSQRENSPSIDTDATTATSRFAQWIRDTLLVPILHYCDSRFPDKHMERQFKRERWIQEKSSAMLASIFLVIQFILFASLQGLNTKYRLYSYIGIVGFFTLPLPFMVGFNGPRRFQWLYQPFVLIATWVTGYLQTIEMYNCNYQLGAEGSTCHERSFLFMFALLFGLPTLASIGLWGHRVLVVGGAVVYVIMSTSLLLPNWKRPWPFVRQPICLVLYHVYISLWSYWRERADRQIFLLRQQLRSQYEELQTAQSMERRAEHSKKQFVSYIFHEVRVPLNTAMLAVQNLEGEGVFRSLDEDQGVMVHGLTSSLGMMEKVLNDVLSFNRMESGRLTQARKPFDFHKSVRVVAFAHKSQADPTHVHFSIELDPRIDKLGLLVGDEMRLRQMTSNLVSNALKFTKEGSVTVVTRLIAPEEDSPPDEATSDMPLEEDGAPSDATLGMSSVTAVASECKEKVKDVELGLNSGLSGNSSDDEKFPRRRHSTEEQTSHSLPNLGVSAPTSPRRPRAQRRYAIVRVEVHDTGPGLRPADLVENRLFSPYVQTEIGRRQGGKGSGLGLALVMQLIKISGGRLGVDSKMGLGSTFWFELQYPVFDAPKESVPPSPRNVFNNSLPFERSVSLSGCQPLPSEISLAERRQSAPEPVRDARFSSLTSSQERGRLGSVAEGRPSSHEERPPRRRTRSDSAQRPSAPSPAQDCTPPLDEAGEQSRLSEAQQRTEQWVGEPGWMLDSASVPPVGAEGEARGTGPRGSAPLSPPPSLKAPRPSPPLPTPTPPQQQKEVGAAANLASIQPPVVSSNRLGDGLAALVVDDDTLTRRLMTRMLQRLGADVSVADNGQSALDAVEENNFDVMFLDNQMPLMSGVEAVRSLRARGSRLFVVGCTGNALEEDQHEYLSAGADAILPKPVHQHDVEAKLVEAKERKRRAVQGGATEGGGGGSGSGGAAAVGAATGMKAQ